MSSKTETLGGRYAGIYKRGSTYSYVVRDASGKQRWRGGFRSPSAAKKDRERVRSDITRGTYVAPTRQTFEDFATEWLETRRPKLRPSTIASYTDLLRNHVSPRLGRLPVQNLTAAHLDALYGELLTSGRRYGEGGLSPRTVRYVHTVIRAVLQTAFRWGRVPRNVADLAEPPAVTRAEARHWNSDELRQFLAHVANDRLGPLFHVAAMSGLRRGEVCGLRWQDVDLERATITVSQSRILVDGKALTSTPKTEAGRRIVALDPRTVDVLRAHRAAQGRDRLRAGPIWEEAGFVFTREDGRPLPPDWVYKRFSALARDGGLPSISFHGLRHSHATALLGAGVDLKLASARLGHSSVRITADTYQHVERRMDEDAAARAAALVLGLEHG